MTRLDEENNKEKSQQQGQPNRSRASHIRSRASAQQKISRCSGYLLLNSVKWDIFLAINSQPLSQQDQHLAVRSADYSPLFLTKSH
jgi:hypothetical protein